MAVTEKQIISGSLITNSTTTIFTAAVKSVVTRWWFTSTHNADITVDLWVVPILGSASDANIRLASVVVSPGYPAQYVTNEVLEVGHTVQAKASVTNKVALSAPGYERS